MLINPECSGQMQYGKQTISRSSLIVPNLAYSIDQENIEERGIQVSNMRMIYEKAMRVVVWLGVDSDNLAEVGFNFVTEIAKILCQNEGIELSELNMVDKFEDIIQANYAYSEHLFLDHEPGWKALYSLF